MEYLLTIKKRNTSTVWMVFKRNNGEIVVRKTNTNKFLNISEAPKYIWSFVFNNVLNENKRYEETVIID